MGLAFCSVTLIASQTLIETDSHYLEITSPESNKRYFGNTVPIIIKSKNIQKLWINGKDIQVNYRSKQKKNTVCTYGENTLQILIKIEDSLQSHKIPFYCFPKFSDLSNNQSSQKILQLISFYNLHFYTQFTFLAPKTLITKGELYAVLSHIKNLTIEKHFSPFTDLSSSHFYTPYVQSFLKHYPEFKPNSSEFFPNEHLSISELHTLLNKLFKKQPNQFSYQSKPNSFSSPNLLLTRHELLSTLTQIPSIKRKLNHYFRSQQVVSLSHSQFKKTPLKHTSSLSLNTSFFHYTVQKGDTLPKIAKKYLGTSKEWLKIATLNNLETITKETKHGPIAQCHIRIGQILKLPISPQ